MPSNGKLKRGPKPKAVRGKHTAFRADDEDMARIARIKASLGVPISDANVLRVAVRRWDEELTRKKSL